MGWPAIGSEELWFESRYASFGIAASRRSTTGHPYRAAVPPLIADLDPVVPSATAAIVDDATEALVRFDAGLGGEIAAFAPLLLRSEAAASSQIEHLTASARAIFTAELGGLVPSERRADRREHASDAGGTRAGGRPHAGDGPGDARCAPRGRPTPRRGHLAGRTGVDRSCGGQPAGCRLRGSTR
ncbi:hypothetical protein DEJ15_03175 [Curtobacterium sp. MCJR17_043]|nr:hypothetical protein [Curtobacterium sp. MCJR17_043]WIB36216.1 hypothetical protein DEJ15_03175 [Curtobacterium sp. MCJR17_043]